MSSLTDGNRHKSTYTYDKLDRITKVAYSNGSAVSYSYDDDGNVLNETDATGTTSFTYDKLNRELTKTLPNHTVITSTYDKVGNLASINDGTGTVTYTYDAANRMTVLTEPDSSKTNYGYDNANRKTSIQYPNDTGMLMTYDGAGHELTNTGGVMNAQGQITTTYDHFVYSYTQGSKHVALQQNVSYLDPVGQSATLTRTYTYNSLNELTGASIQNGNLGVANFTYGYDANGNITSKSAFNGVPTTSVSSTYNAANELTSSTSQRSGVMGSTTSNYTYDGNGNLTGNSTGRSLSYNVANQTTTINANTYAYSGGNQNERVTVNSTTDVYSTLGLSSEQTSSGTTVYVRCSCGLLNNERLSSGQKYYYLFDGLGSIVGMTDNSGHDVNRYDYDPYGNLRNSQQQVSNPWLFAGGYLDSSTSLYKFGIRYYDPSTGRWTQRTPVGGSLQETTKANPYEYAGDDPVNVTDTSGAGCSPLAAAGSLLAAIGSTILLIVAFPPGVTTLAALTAFIAAGGPPAWTLIASAILFVGALYILEDCLS